MSQNLKSMHWIQLENIFTALRRELRSRPEWRHAPRRVHEVAYEGYSNLAPFVSLVGKHYCDLGCGTYHPFGISTAMYLNGAESTLGLDLENAPEQRAAEALFDLLCDCLAFPDRWHWSDLPRAEFLRRLAMFDLAALEAGNLKAGVARTPMRHCVTDIHSPALAEASFDIMTSRAVLEHFLDFGVAADRMFKLLKPGGVAFHLIDLVDHRAYGSKHHHFWSFLAENENWSDGLTNRLRSCEIRPHFERVGFEIIEYRNTRGSMPAGFRKHLSARFQKMSDEELSTTSVQCVLRRPAVCNSRQLPIEDTSAQAA